MTNKAMLTLLFLATALPRTGMLAEEPLPPRALVRIGDHRFYHGPGIMCAVLSPDGHRIASTAGDPVIVLWDAATGKRLRELRVPQKNGWCLAFSSNGKRLAAAYGNPPNKFGVAVFEVETGKLLRQLGDFKRVAAYLQFSADDKQLRVSELCGPVSAWDTTNGKQLRLWKPPSETLAVQGKLSTDCKVIAWEMHLFRAHDGYADDLRVHNADTGELLYQKELKHLWSFAFSSDGKRLAARCDKLAEWETATGKELAALEVPKMGASVLTPNGRQAVIREENHRLRLWDLESRKPTRDLYPGFAPPSYGFFATPQGFSADGETLLYITTSTLLLFNTKTGKERAASGHRAPITPRFSTDGRTLFTTCDERRCSWDVSSEKNPARLTHEPRKAWEVGYWPRSADGRLFLDRSGLRVRVREAATGRVLRELEHKNRIARPGQFSPDATRVLLYEPIDGRSFEPPEVFRLYDAKTGKALGAIEPVDPAACPVFSPNGRLVAWTDRANAIYLHDAITGKIVRALRSTRPLTNTEANNDVLLFSTDCEYLIANRPEQPIRVFQVSSGREIIRFYANPEKTSKAKSLSCSACSPDDRLLAIAEKDSGTIRLLEIASGKVRVEFAGHRHGVHGLDFAPDGKTLASGGEDNVVFLWDVTGARTPAAVKKTPSAWWNDLVSEDGKRAGDAIAGLLRKSEASVAFLQDRLRPAEALDEKRLARLLADLDSDTFEAREAASLELARFGEPAEAALRRALKDRPSLEARRRIEDLLNKLERRELAPETLRTLRAIEVLEHLGTAEARRCLDALAKGAPQTRPTSEAKRALDRLANRR
jgi:WD40 repeat protein